MIILSPRNIGSGINIDNVQFFVDYCNSSILQGDFYSTGFLPTFKVIALSMNVQLTNEQNSEIVNKTIMLTPDERALVQSLFSKQGWFTDFTNRVKIKEFIPTANIESVAVLSRVLEVIGEDYTGDIFTLGTFAFGTPEQSKIPMSVQEQINNPAPEIEPSTEI